MDGLETRRYCELLALETLVVAFIRAAASSASNVQQFLQQLESRRTEELAAVRLTDRNPIESDLAAAEIQEAWTRLMQKVLK